MRELSRETPLLIPDDPVGEARANTWSVTPATDDPATLRQTTLALMHLATAWLGAVPAVASFYRWSDRHTGRLRSSASSAV